ncbi:LysR family transcriptional regulator [Marinobacterium sediminicola]|uniref:DNA-binding transcriptional regulator, LysR family n=1 Tax=Marinobacterium sediminicola TaxID=518898 RepID=A0ABY1S0W1_9GAMM|nr:LysR family transcriptional regulator [Marinobacterium sediminicola]ULG70089.1 LysR family transcriptional regulator [Marinobacterium sediminicola]SMR74900.1 DNA-binding transcriptional regulator, LysR family [Marinobacterium sediminicola]
MRTEHLLYFVTVAEKGSIAAAAAELGRNRSTLSMAISALEDDLNTRLFMRRGNSLALSPVGELILDDCQRLLTLQEKILYQCANPPGEALCELSIGRDDVLTESFWRRVITRIRTSLPDIRLSMRFAGADELPELVRQGQLDLAYAMAFNPDYSGDSLYQQIITKIRMQMMASDQHRLARLTHLNNADLSGSTQITYLDSDQQERFWLANLGTASLALSSFELIRDAIKDRLGWGYVPEPLLIMEEEDSAGLRVLNHGLNTAWYPYLAYSRAPLSSPNKPHSHTDKALQQVHRIVIEEMQLAGIL